MNKLVVLSLAVLLAPGLAAQQRDSMQQRSDTAEAERLRAQGEERCSGPRRGGWSAAKGGGWGEARGWDVEAARRGAGRSKPFAVPLMCGRHALLRGGRMFYRSASSLPNCS